MTAEYVVGDLASKLGLGELEPDEQGLFTFMVDGSLPVFMRLGQEDDSIMFFAGIGTIEADKAGPVCQALLESNHFWKETGGFNLSLIPGTLNVLLAARERLSALPDSSAFDLFDRFVIAAKVWKEKLPTFPEAAPGREIHAGIEAAEEHGDLV